MISETELTWETCFQTYDEEREILLVVSPDDAGGWIWNAFDDDGSILDGRLGFRTALEAQQAAVEWWREQKG